MAWVTNKNHIAVKRKKKGCEKISWLIKHQTSDRGILVLSPISFPKRLIGKRIRLKVEVVEIE